MNQKDYYKILGVDSGADSKQIKEAYRNLAFKYHPDRNRENQEFADKMKSVNEAYAVLSDPQKRREYDAMRTQFGARTAYNKFRNTYTEHDIFRGTDIHQIFEEMSKTFGFRSFDAIFREIYEHGYRHTDAKGGGFIFGYFSGKDGRQAPFQIPKAGRYLFEKISGIQLPSGGEDLTDTITVAPELARDGGPYAYYHKKRAKKLVISIPKGVRDGQRIRLAGLGSEGKGGAKAGDLFLKIRVKKPFREKLMDFLADKPD